MLKAARRQRLNHQSEDPSVCTPLHYVIPSSSSTYAILHTTVNQRVMSGSSSHRSASKRPSVPPPPPRLSTSTAGGQAPWSARPRLPSTLCLSTAGGQAPSRDHVCPAPFVHKHCWWTSLAPLHAPLGGEREHHSSDDSRERLTDDYRWTRYVITKALYLGFKEVQTAG